MNNIVKDEELMLYLEGRLNKEEIEDLKRRLAESGESDLLYHLRRNQVEFLEEFDDEKTEDGENATVIKIPVQNLRTNQSAVLVLDPIRLAAAKADGYLCDIECEEYLLLSMGFSVTKKTLLDEAYKNRWLKDKGMPIYHIGRLLEKYNLTVIRRYDSDIEKAKELLNRGNKLIVVVNAEKLSQVTMPTECANPNHAAVLISISEEKEEVVLFDPQTGNDADTYSMDLFTNAWGDSHNFLVVVNEQGNFKYDPQPIFVDDEILNPDLIELGEAIAENAHEIWARKRMDEGWSWGPKRDDDKKETLDMIPYCNLPEKEKDYDRDMAMQTLKLVQKIGYRIVKS